MSKYRAVRTEVDGIKFASKAEAARWKELLFLEGHGAIEHLCRQVKFPLLVNGKKIGAYIADFTYFEKGNYIVEDVKGFATPLYRWKKKHLWVQEGIMITEIRGWKRASGLIGSPRINDHEKPMVCTGSKRTVSRETTIEVK